MADYLNNESLPDKKALTYGPATITADGNYPSASGIEVRGFRQKYGECVGTWDSATAKWQYSNDGSTWTDVDSASLTADGQIYENNGQPRYWRLNVAGGGGSLSIAVTFRAEVG